MMRALPIISAGVFVVVQLEYAHIIGGETQKSMVFTNTDVQILLLFQLSHYAQAYAEENYQGSK